MSQSETGDRQSDGAIGVSLAVAVATDFFTWFHLQPDEAPRDIGAGHVWHSYRPSGSNFHNLATLNLETDLLQQIDQATLCLDRAFIEHAKDGASARDIAKRFLDWVLPEADRALVASLIDEIGDMQSCTAPVIRYADAPIPDLSHFPSPGYRTFLGYQGDFDQDLATTHLRFVNLNWQRRPLDVVTPPGYDAETMWIWLIVRRWT